MFPTVPVSSGSHIFVLIADNYQGPSDRERLSAHSEVLVLQEWLGISYKDAAHRLYMAELERVKRDKIMYKGFARLECSTKKTLEMAFNTISAIDVDKKSDEGLESQQLYLFA